MSKITFATGMVMAAILITAQSGEARPWGAGMATTVNIEEVRKFQQETAELRNEMMLKSFELRNEYLKSPIDTAKIDSLTRQRNELRLKISDAAIKHGMPGPGYGNSFRGNMNGYNNSFGPGCGRGFMMNAGAGNGMPGQGYGYGQMRRGGWRNW